MEHIVHKKRSRARVDMSAVILIKIFQDLLTQMFEEGIVRIPSSPSAPVWRIQYVSRRTCGYVLIHQFQGKISWRVYGSGVHDKEVIFSFENWRDVIYAVALFGLFSYDETTRMIQEYTTPIKNLPGTS